MIQTSLNRLDSEPLARRAHVVTPSPPPLFSLPEHPDVEVLGIQPYTPLVGNTRSLRIGNREAVMRDEPLSELEFGNLPQ